MNPMKRVGLVAVLAVGVGLLGSTTAWAKPHSAAIGLTNVGDEPQASAGASFTILKSVYKSLGPFGSYVDYTGKLTVTCGNLTPGATYSTPAGSFTGDAEGAGNVSAKVTLRVYVYDTIIMPSVINVVRLDPDGSSTTVLSGEFYGW